MTSLFSAGSRAAPRLDCVAIILGHDEARNPNQVTKCLGAEPLVGVPRRACVGHRVMSLPNSESGLSSNFLFLTYMVVDLST